MKFKLTTPCVHENHLGPCGCATTKEEAFVECKCGAHYTDEVMSFCVFTCYVCNRSNDFKFCDYLYGKDRSLDSDRFWMEEVEKTSGKFPPNAFAVGSKMYNAIFDFLANRGLWGKKR